MSHETKKPTGLKITRKNNSFILSWKIGDKDYGDGQRLRYLLDRASKKDDWSNPYKLGAKVTSKAIAIALSDFYPNSGKPKLNQVSMKVMGKRKTYTEHRRKVTPGWSGWSSKTFTLAVPNVPDIEAELDSTLTNKTKFSWEVKTSDSDSRLFTNVLVEAILVKDCNTIDGSKIKWDSTDDTYQSYVKEASDYIEITEDTEVIESGSYTRFVRICSRGPKGDSKYAYAYHNYSTPKRAEIAGDPEAKGNDAGGIDVKVVWDAASDNANPIEQTTAQYAKTVPAAGMTCPSGASWSDAKISADTSGSDAASFVVDDSLGDDECLFVRINTKHDGNTTPGVPKLALIGKLRDPSDLSVSTDDNTFRAEVTATNNSTVVDSFLAVYYRNSSGDTIVVGIMPHGQSTLTVQCPDWSEEDAIAFGVKAIVGSYAAVARSDGATGYDIVPQMQSADIIWQGGDVPKAPTNVTATAADKQGTALVKWDWPWSRADGAELSWSDHEDAWESTDEPEKYEIPYLRASQWRISGLETGKTWYLRVRLFYKSGDNTIYGPYSEIISLDLAEAPSIPVLSLSSGVITPEGSVNAYWAYSAEDGTLQSYAEICEAVISGGSIIYGDPIAHTETEQHMMLKAKELGWSSGETHYLCVRVMSSGGKFSDAWSNMVPVRVAEELSCSITSTGSNLIEETVVEDGVSITRMAIKDLPLEITVEGADEGCETEIVIERAEDYRMMRPDEKESDGFKGETVVLKTRPRGEGVITIEAGDVAGALDDGAQYNLIATIRDEFGRSAEARIDDITVSWSHQALIPDGRVQVDTANRIAMITPKAPAGALPTDYCEIYRLSLGYPELIVKAAEFGKTYVDPYPAIGEMGGHRIVLKTKNGDYITPDQRPAWKDFFDEEYDNLDIPVNVIEFNGQRVEFEYDVKLSSDSEKDFVEEVYLDGSIQGYWGPAVKKNDNIDTTVIANDADTIKAFERLSGYAGPAHIRAKDGSSYWANIEVSKDMDESDGHKTVKYKFKAQRIESEEYDGVLLEDWK